MGHVVALKEKQLLGKILQLHNLFLDHNDIDASGKAQELGRKVLDKEFAVAFCGHFSAGKSSMINRLIGEEILPSSPIPTSANLVKVIYGEEYARVFFKDGIPRLYPAPYDYETVKNYCKDGDQIESIEIGHKGSGFLKDVVIMDTPGIDSADDAHRIATESALHLADLVFYVMDYNHVQSELNFLFTKELTDAGKELYLVVNMIDKHREEELGFEEFQNSVAESFGAWGVRPKGIFYTSLRNPALPYNQFIKLQQFLKDRIVHRDQLLSASVFNSLVKVSEDHMKLVSLQADEESEGYLNILKEVPEEDWQELVAKHAELKTRQEMLEQTGAKAQAGFANELEDIIKNAYLMPFQTRELAASYLEAMQPGFKAGLFFAKQKTFQERAARLELFFNDLAEKVKAQLDWHIKEFLRKRLKETGIHHPQLEAIAQGFQTDFSKELLENTIKSGAMATGDYVLNYTSDVAEALKRIARRQAAVFRDGYLAEVQAEIEKDLENITNEISHLEHLSSAYRDLKAVQELQSRKKTAIFDILYGEAKVAEVNEQKAQEAFRKVLEEEVVRDYDLVISTKPEDTAALREKDEDITETEDVLGEHRAQLNSLVKKLQKTADMVEGLPGLKRISKELFEKAGRLENQQFTVALFGAFSAGKSSFANALIGEKLLPVSPNPTTAAINKIKPVDKEHPHGTVLVKVKEQNQLLAEVNRSLKLFSQEAANFEDAIEKIASIKEKEGGAGASENLHFSFLRAFANGYPLFSSRSGIVFETDLESFRSYVADEEKSCFVEWIEVYYDCKLTKEGITLVDTPGADSINARHTGVAFDYIKNSDAILFVTYYNHAFSRADREFLIQLGRVKDTFELDKMFFIVNAIDLASSDEEMESVLKYVVGQLVQYGIRKPHLYPVSSLLGLKEKLEERSSQASRFQHFEQAFYSFISQDLMKMAMDSADVRWQQSLQLLESLIHSAEEGLEEKAGKLAELGKEKAAVLSLIGAKEPDIMIKQLNQESDELIYYIKQRVFFRFGEFFREAFNPSLIKEDGRDLKKALQTALDELLSSIGYDLLQEMRASTLRLEAFVGKVLHEFQHKLQAEIQKVNAGLSFSNWELMEFPKLEIEEALKDIDKAMFKKALGLFRNPKSFFEKNEKKGMSDELEQLLQAPADTYLQWQNNYLKEEYSAALTQFFGELLDDYTEQVKEYYEGLESALTIDYPIERLKNTYHSIQHAAKEV